jgi:putative DNA primase/helicase
VHDQSPDNRARFAYPFDFDQSMHPAMWLKFLGQCFEGDTDAETKINYIQEFVGIAMLGQGPKYQLATVLLGKGSNGKGVLCQVVQASMPPGSVCAIPPQDFGQEYRRARIAGKLLNVVSELPEREILDCESIKAMISGDLLTGREIRQSPFDFCSMAAHLLACNRLPNSADHTPGFWRRFVVITFNRVFEGEAKNPDLAEEIMAAELPAIVSWFLAGAQRVLGHGRYTIPDSAVEAVANWKKDADVVQRFVDECCTRLELEDKPSEGTRAAILYTSFKRWALENGNRPMASNVFGARMALLNL